MHCHASPWPFTLLLIMSVAYGSFGIASSILNCCINGARTAIVKNKAS